MNRNVRIAIGQYILDSIRVNIEMKWTKIRWKKTATIGAIKTRITAKVIESLKSISIRFLKVLDRIHQPAKWKLIASHFTWIILYSSPNSSPIRLQIFKRNRLTSHVEAMVFSSYYSSLQTDKSYFDMFTKSSQHKFTIKRGTQLHYKFIVRVN